MTIKTLSLAKESSGVKISKDKITLQLDKKTEKSFKFEGCYSDNALSNVFENHVKKHVTDICTGIDFTLAFFGSPDLNASSLLLSLTCKDLFSKLNQINKSQFLIAASMVQVSENNQLLDLINPHPRKMEIENHSSSGMYVNELSNCVCSSADEVVKFYEEGFQLATSTNKNNLFVNVFNVRILQRPTGGKQDSGIVSSLRIVNMFANKQNANSVNEILGSLSQSRGKPQVDLKRVAFSLVSDVLFNNSNATVFAAVNEQDGNLREMATVLSGLEQLHGSGAEAKPKRNESHLILQQLRLEIGKVRDRIAITSAPDKGDLNHMEKLMKDLNETKKFSWDQTMLRSDQYLAERRNMFANKGLLWILESNRPINRENLQKLQALKDKLSEGYKEQRKVSDKINMDLKVLIDEYTQAINSGVQNDKEAKARVSKIQVLKEQANKEGEKLKEIKNQLKETQEKLQTERQVGAAQASSGFEVAFQAMLDERESTKKENEQLIEDELQRMKLEVEHEKSDLQMKLSSNNLFKSNEEVLENKIELAQLRAEKSAITTQLDGLRREMTQMNDHFRILSEKHSTELEIQQLQNLQTFRAYREVFEEFKSELENRWRGLLDDAIQDAVFLNSRNSELMQSNAALKLEVAQLQDAASTGGKDKLKI